MKSLRDEIPLRGELGADLVSSEAVRRRYVLRRLAEIRIYIISVILFIRSLSGKRKNHRKREERDR